MYSSKGTYKTCQNVNRIGTNAHRNHTKKHIERYSHTICFGTELIIGIDVINAWLDVKGLVNDLYCRYVLNRIAKYKANTQQTLQKPFQRTLL